MITSAEENYLKAILSLSLNEGGKVSTNAISRVIGTSAASVSDMIKKLQEKKLIKYKKYQGLELSAKGKKKAINILRKHRLWETFLVNNLKFNWGEVHDIAEQLEHIKSSQLIDRLDSYLSFPKFDPHGEPIPSKEGKIPVRNTITLNKLKVNAKGKVLGVTLDDKSFLEYLTKLNIKIGTNIEIIDKISFDKSLNIKIDKKNHHVSNQVGEHILIKVI